MIMQSITVYQWARESSKRKNAERKTLKSRMLKSVTGRPKKSQKYFHVQDSTLYEVSVLIA